MVKELQRICEQVRSRTGKEKAQNLAANINAQTLISIHKETDGNKAPGVDGVTKADYSVGIMEKLAALEIRMKNEAYKPHASRRAYIDKPGSGSKRPLGISCYEDKLVEKAVAQLMEIVYEPIFCGFSYGYRPGRSCHQALGKLIDEIQRHKVSFVVEADIRSFFDTLDHEWLIKFLEHDIADRKFIGIIRRLLKAGVMEEGHLLDSEQGTPQGGGASAILANVYLHYALDLWFIHMVQKGHFRGEAYLTRYADDFVCCFQYRDDAEKFRQELTERMAKFGLELATEKTRVLEFGRFAESNRAAKGLGKPETFNFLGFTFYCGRSRNKAFFRVKVKSDKEKLNSKLKKCGIWIRAKRHVMDVKSIIQKLNQSLVGYYNYYAVSDNSPSLNSFRTGVIRLLFKWLNRRSQKRSYSWIDFNSRILAKFPIARPRIKHKMFGHAC